MYDLIDTLLVLAMLFFFFLPMDGADEIVDGARLGGGADGVGDFVRT